MNKNIKILLADDSAFMRQVLKEMLTTLGFSHFVECENGKECVEKFASEKPDLLLVDIIMPEMSGLDVLKKIGKKAKALVVSAIGQERTIKEAMEAGALGYVIKPFEKNQIKKELERILK